MNSCRTAPDDYLNTPIVTVDSQVLTKRDIKNALPEQLNPSDSIAFAEDFIGRWIKSNLMLRQAEINLTSDEKDVERKLQDYRTSLLVHLYQQKILEQKHSPLVTSREIETYYREMRDNFNLQENIIKGIFIKVPKEAPNQDKLRQWYRSKAGEDLLNLESYCLQNAKKYEVFADNWIPFRRINASLPEPIFSEDRFLETTRNYETSDAQFNYYLSIHDVMRIGNPAPLDYVEDRVRAILLNKKRGEFLKNLEQDLYEEALRDKIVKFH
jgi:hypothetical protein